MITDMRELFREIEEGDIINDIDTVTISKTSTIYTDGATYALTGTNERYKRVKKVTRDGKIIYESHHGGDRAGSFIKPRKPKKIIVTEARIIRNIGLLKKISADRKCSVFINPSLRPNDKKVITYYEHEDRWSIYNDNIETLDLYSSTEDFIKKSLYFFKAMGVGHLYQEVFDIKQCLEIGVLEE